eukprot:TRINITY_DN71784_c0_g1_i1.p1 TRINITY_DN71784_c0_g1~~TRINITY_DN71784_c0_g1_i1.p1  ORF type:complete len:279 (-),score=29.24 TRINITY_DN71784_c0_g1_i1:110-946(-)
MKYFFVVSSSVVVFATCGVADASDCAAKEPALRAELDSCVRAAAANYSQPACQSCVATYGNATLGCDEAAEPMANSEKVCQHMQCIKKVSEEINSLYACVQQAMIELDDAKTKCDICETVFESEVKSCRHTLGASIVAAHAEAQKFCYDPGEDDRFPAWVFALIFVGGLLLCLALSTLLMNSSSQTLLKKSKKRAVSGTRAASSATTTEMPAQTVAVPAQATAVPMHYATLPQFQPYGAQVQVVPHMAYSTQPVTGIPQMGYSAQAVVAPSQSAYVHA